MDREICLKRTNYINNRLSEVYKECYREMKEIAEELNISKIIFSLHENLGIDVPSLVFEKEDYNTQTSVHDYFELEEMVFEGNYIGLNATEIGYSAYMDEYWGDYFDVGKIGQIYKAFMEIVGYDDLKPIELR